MDDQYLTYIRALPCNWFLYRISIRRAVRSPIDAGSGPEPFNIVTEMHASENRPRLGIAPYTKLVLINHMAHSR